MKPTMKRLLCLAGAALALALSAPGAALAHPLGNFSVNRYSRIEPTGEGVRIVYVLDMAEIPTFQERSKIDLDGDGRVADDERERHADRLAEEVQSKLWLAVDGTTVVPRLASRSLSFPPGQGGLPTLRLDATFVADLPNGQARPIHLIYQDDNDPGRLGWREIVARPGTADTRIQQADVPPDDRTDELRQYPEDPLSSPLDVRTASLTFIPGAAPLEPRPAEGAWAIERPTDVYAQLATTEDLSPPVILSALLVALVLGALHALSPGHGKTVVAAYLVGSRGTAGHAVFLGATVTATHTAGVYALGLVTLYLSQYVLPERLYPILQLVSGLLVVGIGVGLFAGRLQGALAARPLHAHPPGDAWSHDHDGHDQHEHHHGHRPGHAHRVDAHAHRHGGHSHTHLPPGADGRPASWRSLVALGVSGGLLPCPSALVVLLSAVALHRVAFGLLLIVAFSIGLAVVLVGIGLLLVSAGRLVQRLDVGPSVATRLLPIASAMVMIVAGLAIMLEALPQVL
jgi:ABC-type nickel/cobalt efflux system permease component RcnA